MPQCTVHAWVCHGMVKCGMTWLSVSWRGWLWFTCLSVSCHVWVRCTCLSLSWHGWLCHACLSVSWQVWVCHGMFDCAMHVWGCHGMYQSVSIRSLECWVHRQDHKTHLVMSNDLSVNYQTSGHMQSWTKLCVAVWRMRSIGQRVLWSHQLVRKSTLGVCHQLAAYPPESGTVKLF